MQSIVNDRLSARLNRAGIDAGLCTCHLPISSNGKDEVGFMLPEYAQGGIGVYFLLSEAEGMEDRIPQDQRVAGAAIDRIAGLNQTVDEWMNQLIKADKAVCDHFGITQKVVFVSPTTGQIELHLITDKTKGTQARWMRDQGWFSY